MGKLYPTQEIGSLAKPRWRTKGLTQPLTVKDLAEAEEWAGRLGIGNYHDRAKQLQSTENQKDRIRELLELSTIYGLRLFERTGLDNEGVGGEQQRVEMYEHVIRGVEGMRVLGHVQSFDYKYFNKAVAESKIQRKHPIYLQEFLDVKKNAKRQLKVPLDLDTGCFLAPSCWLSVSETCRPCFSRSLALLSRKRATGCCHVQSRSHLAGVEGSQRSPTPECGTIRESDIDLDRRTGAG